ncbi:MAG: hypothetical protein ACO1Q7_17430 [Gemmatimonas sp.]
MIRSTMVTPAVALMAAFAGELGAQPVLKSVDSVLVKETESSYISRLGGIVANARGDVFVSDLAEGRVVQIASNGNVVGTISRKGDGPGEIRSPSSLAIIGDSLFVFSAGQKRISVFQLSTRKFVRSMPVNLRSFTSIEAIGNELVAHITDPKTFTSVAVIGPSGAFARQEGGSPEFLRKNPKFLEATSMSAMAARGTDAWSASEYSQSLFHWKRGTTTVIEELKLPVRTRYGLDESVLLEVIRDPSKAALFYKHSSPLALHFISPDVLALLTIDPTFTMPSPSTPQGKMTSAFHLTLVDVKTKKMCGEFKLPIPDDPQPQVDLVGDMLVVFQQASLANGDAASALRRFRIDPKSCTWKAL